MEFKVGDWVISNNQALKVEAINDMGNPCIFDGTWLKEIGTHELWQPKEGEWCWLNKELAKITSKDNDGYVTFLKSNGTYSAYHKIDTNFISKYCEPFIGELPSFLKDKQCGFNYDNVCNWF